MAPSSPKKVIVTVLSAEVTKRKIMSRRPNHSRLLTNREEANMETIGKKFNVGDKVYCSDFGDGHGRILGYYSTAMVDVRVWNGLRHVGDICVDERGLEKVVSGDLVKVGGR